MKTCKSRGRSFKNGSWACLGVFLESTWHPDLPTWRQDDFQTSDLGLKMAPRPRNLDARWVKSLQLDPPMLEKPIKTNGFLRFLHHPQNRVKLPPRPPRWHPNLPSWFQDAPKLASGPSTWPPRPVKIAPRSSNVASRSRPRASKMAL